MSDHVDECAATGCPDCGWHLDYCVCPAPAVDWNELLGPQSAEAFPSPEYPYQFMDDLAAVVAPETANLIRALNEVGLAVCQRLDHLIALNTSGLMPAVKWVAEVDDG